MPADASPVWVVRHYPTPAARKSVRYPSETHEPLLPAQAALLLMRDLLRRYQGSRVYAVRLVAPVKAYTIEQFTELVS